MQRVKMLKTLPGVKHGEVYPTIFNEGEEYELDHSLVACFMDLGGCELIGLPEERETKVDGPEEAKPSKKKK